MMTADEAARHLRLSIGIADSQKQRAIDVLCNEIERLQTALARPPDREEWIAYADKLESALRMIADISDDQLKRMQATEALRLVRPGAVEQEVKESDK